MTAAGALTALINAVLTPVMALSAPFAQVAASGLFLARQSGSALAATLLLLGAIGVYLGQDGRAGRFGAIAFLTAIVGSALLLAWEWVDIFLLRELALRAPATLEALEASKGMSLYTLGALIPLGVFTLGWIALAASTMRASPSLRAAAGTVIAGFFVSPLLTAAAGPVVGGVVGNAVLGLGWGWLGVGVRNAARNG